MLRRSIVTGSMLVVLAAPGCSKDNTGEAAADAAVAATHAPAEAKPGSYEDWCDEHGVPESQCTLCHPELIAAFKATGDWCVDHSLPKSHCKKCNPALRITRPPKTN